MNHISDIENLINLYEEGVIYWDDDSLHGGWTCARIGTRPPAHCSVVLSLHNGKRITYAGTEYNDFDECARLSNMLNVLATIGPFT
ncbi:MAG: hypothetical protein AAF512_01355 [Pseudomonadota bacterium]